MSRLMLAKMKTLEESLGDVVREMRVLRSAVPSTAHNSGDDGSNKNRACTRRVWLGFRRIYWPAYYRGCSRPSACYQAGEDWISTGREAPG